jgi:hypothetical protein
MLDEDRPVVGPGVSFYHGADWARSGCLRLKQTLSRRGGKEVRTEDVFSRRTRLLEGRRSPIPSDEFMMMVRAVADGQRRGHRTYAVQQCLVSSRRSVLSTLLATA